MKIAITGANGHLGMRLIGEIYQQHNVIALVRSESAARAISQRFADKVECKIVNYADAKALSIAAKNATVLVHLVGIIKENKFNSFYQAHEATSQALIDMCNDGKDAPSTSEHIGLQHIIYLSLLGVDEQSNNPCLASRARAEEILATAPVNVSILRVPMVLGEGDFASGSLKKRVTKSRCFILRGESLEQPIYAGDVIKAITSRINCYEGESVSLIAKKGPSCVTLELAGAESLTRTALTRRAAACLGGNPSIVSVSLGLIMKLAWVFEMTMSNPPVTRAMLGVLDHDDNIDVEPAITQLGITLTSLDETLTKVLRD